MVVCAVGFGVWQWGCKVGHPGCNPPVIALWAYRSPSVPQAHSGREGARTLNSQITAAAAGLHDGVCGGSRKLQYMYDWQPLCCGVWVLSGGGSVPGGTPRGTVAIGAGTHAHTHTASQPDMAICKAVCRGRRAVEECVCCLLAPLCCNPWAVSSSRTPPLDTPAPI